MRKLISSLLIVVTFVLASASYAQSVSKIKLDGTNVVPTTTIKATIYVKKEIVRSGPYARFAQKFLGIIVPLTDKDIYTIYKAELSHTNNVNTGVSECTTLLTDMNMDFSKVTEDRFSSTILSVEDMARNAANTIFKLRRSRLDLITGEAGENVFNAGLSAALSEIKRLESEILALFIGKQNVAYDTNTFYIEPKKGESNYIIARFSETSGVLSELDLSGEPILLNIKMKSGEVEKTTQMLSEKSSKRVDNYHVAANTECHILRGNELLANLDVQIFQLGDIIMVPNSKKK